MRNTVILVMVMLGMLAVIIGVGGSDKVHGTLTPPAPSHLWLTIAGSVLIVLALSWTISGWIFRAWREAEAGRRNAEKAAWRHEFARKHTYPPEEVNGQ